MERCLAGNKTCTVLPAPFKHVPATSSKGWDLIKLRENVWTIYNGDSHSMITFDNGILLVLDAPNIGASVLEDGRLKQNIAINMILKGKPLRLVRLIYGHRHYDHIGYMHKVYGSLRAQYPNVPIEVYGNQDIVRYLNRDRKNPMPKVTNIVPYKGLVLESSENLSHRLFLRRGHTLSDTLFFIPKNKKEEPGITFIADYITTKFTPWAYFGVAQDLFSYMATLRFMLKLEFEIYVPGHGFVGDKQDVQDTLDYATDVFKYNAESGGEVTSEMLQQVNYFNAFTPGTVEYGNRHFPGKTFLDLANGICARKLIAKWGCKLGGVAMLAQSHCFSVTIYEAIEKFKP